MSSILSGECLARIRGTRPTRASAGAGAGGGPRPSSATGGAAAAAVGGGGGGGAGLDSAAALEDVTALYYNEERNEIYTGNKDGCIHIWSN